MVVKMRDPAGGALLLRRWVRAMRKFVMTKVTVYMVGECVHSAGGGD